MRYSSGVSGNYNGRPVGSKNKRTQLAALLESRAEDLTNKLIELTMSGNVKALSICVDRLLPKARHDALDINLPSNIDQADTGKLKMKVLNSVLNGVISVDGAEKIINLIEDVFKKSVSRELSLGGVTDPVEASKIYQQIIADLSHS